MKGIVEIYEHNGNSLNQIYKDENLIVDGAMETVVDILTHKSAPSGVSSVALNDVSSYIIQAITLGPPQYNLVAHDSRMGLEYIHASGSHYLNVSGEGSGIHVLHSLLNKTLEEFGGVNKPSRDQESPYAILSTISPDELEEFYSFGESEVIQTPWELTVKKLNSQAVKIYEVPAPILFGKDYKFVLEGLGEVELAVVSIQDFLGNTGGVRYFNFETGKFQIKEYYTATDLKEGERREILMDNLYYPQDASLVGGSIGNKYKVLIRLPKPNLFDRNSATFSSLTISEYDSYYVNNSLFDRNYSWIKNTEFDLQYPDSIIDPLLAKQLGIVNLHGWAKTSYIEKSSNPVAELSSLGYVSIDSTENSFGVKLIASSLEGSSGAAISQRFTPPDFLQTKFLKEFTHKAGGYKPFIVIHFDLYQASANAQGLNVELRDITNDEYFGFSGTAHNANASWGANIPWIVGQNHPLQYKRHSIIVPIGNRITSTFEIIFKGNGTGSAFNTYIIRNLFVGSIVGWQYGFANSLSGNLEYAAFEDGYGLVISANTQHASPVGRTYSDTEYFGGKLAGLDPKKAYNLVIDANPVSSTTSRFGVLISHKSFTNVDDYQPLNLMALAGLLKLDEPAFNNKSGYLGYLKYLNPTTSPSGVNSIVGGNRINDESYNTFERGVKFDAAFQNDGVRLFVPIDAGTHTMSWEFYDDSEIEEEYVVSFYFRARNNTDKHLWYNFEDQKFELFDRSYSPPVQLSATGKYVYNLKDNNQVTFTAFRNQLENFLIPDSECAGMILQFYGIRNGGMNLNFSGNVYFGETYMTGNYHTLSSTEWFEEGGRTGLAYYRGAGDWALSSTNGSLLGTMMEPYIPDSLIYFDASAGKQVSIPIYGQDHFDQNFFSNAFGLGEVSAGATPYSTYDIFIFHVSGGGALFKKVALTDYSLGAYGGPSNTIPNGTPTSERDFNWINNEYEDGWHIKIASSTASKLPIVNVDSMSGITGLIVSSASTNYKPVFVNYTKQIGDLNLHGTKFKYSVDYCGDLSNNYSIKTGLIYVNKSNQFIWDFQENKFKEYFGSVSANDLNGYVDIGPFPYNAANTTAVENWISSAIILPEERNQNDLITSFFLIEPTGTNSQVVLRNLRFYSLMEFVEASSIFPEFPNPRDTFLQTPTVSSVGHFENRIEMYGKEIEEVLEYEDALYKGAYLPGAGMPIFSGGTYVSAYGNLNQYNVITPQGYILRQMKTSRATQTIFDSSAGLLVSAINPLNDRQVIYALTLTADEWYLLNKYYGGIGAIGLWTLDFEKSARKLGSENGIGGPPFIYSGTPTSLESNYGGPGTGTTVPGSTTPPFRNSRVLFGKGAKIGNAVFHTNFSDKPGRVVKNGWAIRGHQYRLTFAYKTNSDYAGLVSDNFAEVSLPKSSNWANKEILFTASGNGYDSVLFKIREATDPASLETPKLLLDNVILSGVTVPGGIANYQFTNETAIKKFKTSYPLPNTVKLGQIWDGAVYSTSLYNTSFLIEKEPVFRLLAKKVFFPGGIQINPSSNFLTLIWTLEF